MIVASIGSFIGSVWFGLFAFAAGLLLADPIKQMISRIVRRG